MLWERGGGQVGEWGTWEILVQLVVGGRVVSLNPLESDSGSGRVNRFEESSSRCFVMRVGVDVLFVASVFFSGGREGFRAEESGFFGNCFFAREDDPRTVLE